MNKGGEVAGKGSYGIVYINPRPVCKGEKNNGRNDQAGKVFFKKNSENKYVGREDAKEEMESFIKIKKKFHKSMKTIKKYAILPEKKCLIHHKLLPTNQEWYADKKGQIYNDIQDPQVTDMIVYEKAISTAEDAFHQIQTEEEFFEYVHLMNKLEKGIRLLHEHELYHNDIKGSNMVLIENKQHKKSLKLIDFGFLIQGVNDPEFVNIAVRPAYQPYPPNVVSLIEIENIETRKYIIQNIEKNRYESIYNNLYEPFHKPHVDNEIKSDPTLEKMCSTLIIQKSLGFHGFYELAKKCEDKNDWYKRFPKVVNQFIDYLNKTVHINPYFQKSHLSRKELCENIDLYSFGIVLLKLISNAPYIVNKNKLLPLYKKAFVLCNMESDEKKFKIRKTFKKQ